MHLDHGRKDKYEHQFAGGNFRIDGLQAAVLNVKLKYLPQWTKNRQAHAKIYDDLLKPKGFKVLEPFAGSESVYHLYVVEVSNRDEVIKHMQSKDIHVGVHYPITMSRQPALQFLEPRHSEFVVSDRVASRIMSLPMYAELTRAQIEQTVYEFLKVAAP